MGRGAAGPGYRRPGGARRARALSVCRLYQLSYCPRYARQWYFRARSDASDESCDPGGRRGQEHARKPARLDRPSRHAQTGCAHAGYETVAPRPGSTGCVPADATLALGRETMHGSSETLDRPEEGAPGQLPVLAWLHEWVVT